jgi:cytochrome c
LRRSLVFVGAVLGIFLISCEKKEEGAQKPVKEGKENSKEEVVKKEVHPLADSKGCLACHDVQRKKVGPAFSEVAKKYAGKENAVEEIVQSITKGSMGKWGSIPMTPQPVTEEEARKLAEWILSLK